MNKEVIAEKLLIEKNARLIDIFEIGSKYYAKAIILFDESEFKIENKYYDVTNGNIKELEDDEQDEISQFFSKDYGNIVY